MLFVENISKSFELQIILKDITFRIRTEDRIGLVGRNGSGKTTLMKILLNQLSPDSGHFRFSPATLRIGYLPQTFPGDLTQSVGEFIQLHTNPLEVISKQLEKTALQLGKYPDDENLQKEYQSLLDQLTSTSSSFPDHSAFLKLGIGPKLHSMQIKQLSGGQRTRLQLAGMIASKPKMLLLDEPTNHLDIEMLNWLENWILEQSIPALIISHDRTFLDKTVNGILELNPLTHSMKRYNGNYSDYLDQKQEEQQRIQQAWLDQQNEIEKLKKASQNIRSQSRFREGGKGDTNDGFAKGFFSDRMKMYVSTAKNIEKRVEKLLSEDRKEKPERQWSMKLDFEHIPEANQTVLSIDSGEIGYEDQPLIKDITLSIHDGDRIALIGPNGCGKTSLLKTLLRKIPMLSGKFTMGSKINPGYMDQEQRVLPDSGTPLDLILNNYSLSETEARSFLSKFLFKGDEVFKDNSSLSNGEKARLTLGYLAAKGCNFLILDEPINHLDIDARNQFEEALLSFEGAILAVTHDRYFIKQFASHIWEIKENRIDAFAFNPDWFE